MRSFKFNNPTCVPLLLAMPMIFLFLLIWFPQMGRSDENLINSLCGKTQEPAACKECLEADPESNSADAQRLALFALSCAEKDTTYLHDDILKLLHTSDIDIDDATGTGTGMLNNIIQDCAANSSLMVQEFVPVESYVEQGLYGAAKDIITEGIIPSVNYCFKLFDEAKELAMPPKVLAGTLAANQTCKIAAGILSSLSIF